MFGREVQSVDVWQGSAEFGCVAGRCRVWMCGREVQSVDRWQGGAECGCLAERCGEANSYSRITLYGLPRDLEFWKSETVILEYILWGPKCKK